MYQCDQLAMYKLICYSITCNFTYMYPTLRITQFNYDRLHSIGVTPSKRHSEPDYNPDDQHKHRT